MATNAGPKLVTGSMSLYIDAGNTKSYSTGSICKDIVGDYGDLSLIGTVNYNTEVGGVLDFNGNSYVETDTVFVQSSEMTWDIWFNRTSSINSFNMLFTNSVPYLAFRSTGIFFFFWYTKLAGVSTTRTLSSPLTYTDSKWYNVVCTLVQDTVATTSTVNMYVNGVIVATQTTAAGTLDSIFQAGRLRIGNNTPAAYPFNGKISNLKIYNRILTAPEVLQNYNAQKTRFGH